MFLLVHFVLTYNGILNFSTNFRNIIFILIILLLFFILVLRFIIKGIKIAANKNIHLLIKL